MVLLIHTFKSLLKWKSTLIYLLIISIVPIILGFVLREMYQNSSSMLSQVNQTIGIYNIEVFMWILGVPFLLNASAKGIGLISNEISDGTLGLLVSMKISRFKILFYKWIALYIVMIILGIVSIFLNYSIITIVSNMDYNVKIQLVGTIPNLIKYLLIIGFIVSALSILISLIIKSKINAVLSMTVFIIFIFLISPLFRNFLVGYYDKYYLYYFDLNYHFSLIYFNFINVNNILTPEAQSIMGMFMGIFDLGGLVDQDLSMILSNPIYKAAPVLDYIKVDSLLIFWIVLGFLSLVVSIRILIRRDIT